MTAITAIFLRFFTFTLFYISLECVALKRKYSNFVKQE